MSTRGYKLRVRKYINVGRYRGSQAEEAELQAVYNYAQEVLQLATDLAPVSPIRDPSWVHLYETGRVQSAGRRVIINFGENLPDPRAPIQEIEQPYIKPAIEALDIDTFFHSTNSGRMSMRQFREAIASLFVSRKSPL